MTKFSQRLILVLLALVAVAFSTYKLTESPPVWYDEGFYFQSAANLAAYGQTGLELSPGYISPSSRLITVGYPLIYPLALWFKVFGISVASARSLMVVFILGFLAACYFLSRRLFGNAVSLAVLALLVTFPPLYGNGKSVLGEVPGMLYLALSLFFFSQLGTDLARKRFRVILVGLFAGICLATKPIFLLLLPALVVGVIIEWRRGVLGLKDVIVMAVSGAVPFLVWTLVQFQASDSLRDIITYYANPYQISDLSSLIIQNIKRLFTDTGTLYLVGLIAVWIVSLTVRIKSDRRIPAVEAVGLVFSLLIIAAFVRTAGWYRYLFEAQLLAIIFFPNALSVIIERLEHLWEDGQWLSKFARRVGPAVIVVLSLLGIYQLRFDSWVAQAYDSDKTAFWESYFRTLPASTSIFFYDTPEVALFSPYNNYYQYFNPSGFVIGGEGLSVVENGLADVLIIRSDTLSAQGDLLEEYQAEQVAYKYTILRRRGS